METKTIVGIRGLARGAAHWGPFVEQFKKLQPNMRFLTVEIPGNGTRTSVRSPIDPTQLVSELRTQLPSNTDQVHLLGISLGGMAALKWAELFPQQVSSLVIINSSLCQLSPFFKRLKLPSAIQLLRASLTSSSELREKITLGLTSNQPERWMPVLDQYSQFGNQYPVKFINLVRQLKLASHLKLESRTTQKGMILASRHDRLVDFSCSENIAKFQNWPMMVHESAGHDLPLDDPNWVIKALIQFYQHLD